MAAARALLRSRLTGESLPRLSTPPATVDEGYLVQSELTQLFLQQNPALRPIGWKIANTNPSSQAFLETATPFFGPLVSGNHPKKINVGIVEPEIAFLLGENLEPIEMAPAIEIVHSSFENWRVVGLPSLIADMACNGDWRRGASRPFDASIFSKPLEIRLKFNDEVMSVGSADRVMGESPLRALEWIRRHAGDRLRPGDWVTTGVCVDPPYENVLAKPNGVFLAEFEGGLGSVSYET